MEAGWKLNCHSSKLLHSCTSDERPTLLLKCVSPRNGTNRGWMWDGSRAGELQIIFYRWRVYSNIIQLIWKPSAAQVLDISLRSNVSLTKSTHLKVNMHLRLQAPRDPTKPLRTSIILRGHRLKHPRRLRLSCMILGVLEFKICVLAYGDINPCWL